MNEGAIRDHWSASAYRWMGIAAFFGMWSSVLVFWWGQESSWDTFLNFFPALVANGAVTMLTIEMTAMALATSLLIYREARPLGIAGPRLILILFLAATVGFGVVVPLFLAYRERRLGAA